MLIYGTCFTLSLNLKCPIEGVVSIFSFSYVKGVVKYKGKRETCCLTSQFWPHNKQYADVWSNIAYWDIFIRYYIYYSQKSHGLGSWSRWRKEDDTWFVNCAVARVSQKLVTGYFRYFCEPALLKAQQDVLPYQQLPMWRAPPCPPVLVVFLIGWYKSKKLSQFSALFFGTDALVGEPWWRKMITIFACQNFHDQKMLRTSESWI